MSQFSETTKKTQQLEHLNYPEQHIANGYYTARLTENVGVCVAVMVDRWMVQFFPWGDPILAVMGHTRYAAFITDKATSVDASVGALFNKWPFLQCEASADLLTLKCLIEEGRKQVIYSQVGGSNEELQRGAADAAAGKVVE